MLIDAVAIDFDDTFSSDVNTWSYIINILQNKDYRVICATARSWSESNEYGLQAVLPKNVKIIFCGDQFKRTACEAAGFNVTIWIDDCPSGIEESSGIVWMERLKSFVHSTKNWIKRHLTSLETKV